jgi:hypothetical protein
VAAVPEGSSFLACFRGVATAKPTAAANVAEAAQALGISPRTADRVWASARAWLHRELTDTAADPESEK